MIPRSSAAFYGLRNRTANIEQTGQGIAYIHDDFSERDAKNVVQLLKRGLKRFEDGDAPDVVVALVPRNPNRKQFVRFSVATGNHGTAEFHSCVSRTGTYGSPDGFYATGERQHALSTLRSFFER